MLVPVIGLVQVGEQAHADRYTYLPQIGLYIMIAWTVGDLLLESTRRFRRALVGVIAAMAVVSLGARAFGQTSYWKNSETLWNHALAVTGENDVAHNNLGFLFIAQRRIRQSYFRVSDGAGYTIQEHSGPLQSWCGTHPKQPW